MTSFRRHAVGYLFAVVVSGAALSQVLPLSQAAVIGAVLCSLANLTYILRWNPGRRFPPKTSLRQRVAILRRGS